MLRSIRLHKKNNIDLKGVLENNDDKAKLRLASITSHRSLPRSDTSLAAARHRHQLPQEMALDCQFRFPRLKTNKVMIFIHSDLHTAANG